MGEWRKFAILIPLFGTEWAEMDLPCAALCGVTS